MEIIIDKDYENTRFDKFLRKYLKDEKLSDIFKYIRSGKIKVNGRKQKQDYRLCIGDKIFLPFEKEDENFEFINLKREELDFFKSSIIYEDEDIFIFNKENDVVMHKGSGHEYGISEMAKSYYKNKDISFANRIDKSTSGLIIGAKNLNSLRELNELIREDKINKYYYVLVKGNPQKKEFMIESLLKKTETKVIVSDDGKKSISKFKLLNSSKIYSLLEAKLISGRTHQLRVQLAENNLPIVGDYKYGYKEGKIMCLHSYKIEIPSKNIIIFTEIPEYFLKKLNIEKK